MNTSQNLKDWFLKDTNKQLTENIEDNSLTTMTSHGVKVAAFNLAEMKSKEADRREEEASVRVVETDFELAELARQWRQLRATADRVRKASEAASAEALQLANKMVRAEEELDESRRLSEEENRCPQEFKVGSWGSTLKEQRHVRETMAKSGVYLVSEGGHGRATSTRRINSMRAIRVGDIIHMPMYKQGYEYVGKIHGYVDTQSWETILQSHPDVRHIHKGPSQTETFTSFTVEWKKVQLTDKSEKELKKLVKDGGRCISSRATIIRMK